MKIRKLLQELILVICVFASSNIIAQIGINTTTPAYQFQMINSGNVGAAPMAQFLNQGTTGVSLTGYNSGTNNGYNGIEGITEGTYSGVFGLGINQDNGGAYDATGVFGQANDFQGIGVLGVRSNLGGGADTGFGGAFYNDLGYTGYFGAISDRKTKKNIISINSALTIISKLNPVSYYFDLNKYPTLGLNKGLEYGFISQEVKEILPEITKEKRLNTLATTQQKLGSENKSKMESFLMIDYTRLIPILTKGIQEQQEIIISQDEKIKSLEEKLKALEEKVNLILKN